MNARWCAFLLLCAGASVWAAELARPEARSRLEELDEVITDAHSQVAAVCREMSSGEVRGARVITTAGTTWLKPSSVTLAPESFDQDLNKVVAMMDRLDRIRAELQRAANGGPALTPDQRLRMNEGRTPETARNPAGAAPSFNVLEEFDADRKRRQAARDEAAEADVRRVAEERRIAEAEHEVEVEKQRRIAEINRRWQEELDAQTEKDVAEAEAWQREHSAGAIFRKLTRTVVGGAVTSFTGGFAQGIGSGAADYVIRKRFPDFRPTGEYEKNND